MSKHLRSPLPVALLVLASLSGCKNDVADGAASVDFVLGNNLTCEEAGVEDIRVTLSRGDSEEYVETAPCSAGPVDIEGITPKNYDLLVEAIDNNGVAIMDNLADTGSELKLEIFEGATAEPTIDLTAKPAILRVRWDFGFSNCEAAGIESFRIRAFEVGGAALVHEGEIDCLDPGEEGGWHVLEDEDRELNGNLIGEVGVVPLDSAGDPVGEQASFEFDPVGAGYPIDLSVECGDTGCTAI